MVWAAFCEKGKTRMAFLSGKQNALKYTETLRDYLLPFVADNLTGSWIFQQDNASIHTAVVTKKWFEANNIDVMPWPARSPDLNPIENLWAILAQRVYGEGRQFNSVLELKECINREWEKIERHECYTLLRSMNKRCACVLERGGGSFDY